ncbi:hypothetical protein [Streptomyces tendae]|uniref:hypothetical protein n=1 Tax=Streptomyces tendae TaxID=1932 RepID=UPI003EBB0DB4
MTKSGSDYLKGQAREIARTTGRRFPDVLAELQHRPVAHRASVPSSALVVRCPGLASLIDGGRCAQGAGHPGYSTWCGSKPNIAVYVLQGYAAAHDEAQWARHEAWLAGLTPSERADYEADIAQQMADDARESYGSWGDEPWNEQLAIDLAEEAAEIEREEAALTDRVDEDGQVDLSAEDYDDFWADLR